VITEFGVPEDMAGHRVRQHNVARREHGAERRLHLGVVKHYDDDKVGREGDPDTKNERYLILEMKLNPTYR
jgi:hypothetical protein